MNIIPVQGLCVKASAGQRSGQIFVRNVEVGGSIPLTSTRTSGTVAAGPVRVPAGKVPGVQTNRKSPDRTATRGALGSLKDLARQGRDVARRLRQPDEAPDPRPTLIRLLFPEAGPEQVSELADRLPPYDSLTGHDLRRLLAGVDRMHSVSPVTVRARRSDVHKIDLADFSMWIDEADSSVSHTVLSERIYEPHLTRLMKHFLEPGMTFVDVGSNIGYFTLLAAAAVGPTGRVYAVEANSENCRLILSSVMSNGFDHVELLPFAASDKAGWAYFTAHVGSNGGLIGESLDTLIDTPGEVVPCATLDSLLGDQRVDFLKLDVEGAEGLVLNGAIGVLERHQPIVTSELSAEMMERVSGVTLREYVHTLEARGYTGFVIERTDETVLRPVAGADALVAEWPGRFHLEDLLFLPPQRAADAAPFLREGSAA
jgi:FkbM family methyltransferase